MKIVTNMRFPIMAGGYLLAINSDYGSIHMSWIVYDKLAVINCTRSTFKMTKQR